MASITLTRVEKELMKKKNKTIIIRPKEKGKKVKKGDEVESGGMKLLVLDVRKYPRIGDLIRIENLTWITVDAGDDVEARKVLEEKFYDDHSNGEEFFAIEFAPQM